MSRKKTVINPLMAERLKMLINDTGLTQGKFAHSVNHSQQLISDIVNGKTALVLETAQDIERVYPDYNAEWLLGLRDHRNDDEALRDSIIKRNEAFRDSIIKMHEDGDLLNTAFISLASLNGYHVNSLGYRGESVEEIVSSLYDYVEIEHDGAVQTLTIKQLNQLENIICSHAEVTIREYLKGVEINGKHKGGAEK